MRDWINEVRVNDRGFDGTTRVWQKPHGADRAALAIHPSAQGGGIFFACLCIQGV